MKTDGDSPTENAELREANANLEAISGRAIKERDALCEQVGKLSGAIMPFAEVGRRIPSTWPSINVLMFDHSWRETTYLKYAAIGQCLDCPTIAHYRTAAEIVAKMVNPPSPSPSCPLESRCKGMEEALKFYADRESYVRRNSYAVGLTSAVDNDEGGMARQALATISLTSTPTPEKAEVRAEESGFETVKCECGCGADITYRTPTQRPVGKSHPMVFAMQTQCKRQRPGIADDNGNPVESPPPASPSSVEAPAKWTRDGCVVFGLNDDGTGISFDSEETAKLVASAPFEKQRRIHWQSLAYAAMLTVDKLLGLRIPHQCTEQNFLIKLDELKATFSPASPSSAGNIRTGTTPIPSPTQQKITEAIRQGKGEYPPPSTPNGSGSSGTDSNFGMPTRPETISKESHEAISSVIAEAKRRFGDTEESELCDCPVCGGEGFVGDDGSTCPCIRMGCKKKHRRDDYLKPSGSGSSETGERGEGK